MLNDLAEFIALPTVEGAPAGENAPFGPELRKALDLFLDKAKAYGLRTGENKGYYGWAEYGDERAPLIGIAVHLDVVPAGEGWETDPFAMRAENGRVYGRGVADDKGPLVAMLHVLKRLREERSELRHRVRLIVGCNEETGSRCLKKYAEEDEIPVVTLVPDADFPVINSEKGILHAEASFRPDGLFGSSVLSLSAGERPNVVPGSAEVILRADGEIGKRIIGLGADFGVFSSPAVALKLLEAGGRPEDMGIENRGDSLRITAAGVAGHAAYPEKGENALWKIWAFLAGIAPDCPTAVKIAENFCRRDAAQKLGIYAEDALSGKLTMNMGVARYDGGEMKIKFDFRMPLAVKVDDVERKLGEALPKGTVIKREHFADNLYKAEDSPLVSILLRVYAEETGEKSPRPIQTGGGTYARELPEAIAFGPTFPGEETNIHNADESISIAHLYKLADIYYSAIKELDKAYNSPEK